MKNQMMEMFTQMGQKVQAMLEDDQFFLDTVAANVESKYREDFFKALKVLGLNDRITAQIALGIKLEVNRYDEELSEKFVQEMVIPVLKLHLKNKDKLTVHKHLSDEELLLVVAKVCSFTYNI